MNRKTLIGTAAAALIATGATVATSGSAAASSVTIAGSGFSLSFGTPGVYPYPNPYPPRQVCQPVFKTVQYWKWGKLHTSTVKVGEKCTWVGGNPGPFPPKPYPFPKPFPYKPGPWAWQQGPHW